MKEKQLLENGTKGVVSLYGLNESSAFFFVTGIVLLLYIIKHISWLDKAPDMEVNPHGNTQNREKWRLFQWIWDRRKTGGE